MFAELFGPLIGVFGFMWLILKATWWFVAPVFMWEVTKYFWLFYIRSGYIGNIKWVQLEVRIPKEVLRTPKAMEQVFVALHGIDTDVKRYEKWWYGKVVPWVSFELVGYAGGVYFFIRCGEGERRLIEAAIYGHYPEAEIKEVSDYTELLPKQLPNKTYDLFGFDLVFIKPSAYPIRTYEYFENLDEDRRVDPMGIIGEGMSNLKEGEMIWIQLLLEPIEDDWKKLSDAEVRKLMGEKPKVSPGIFDTLFSALSVVLSTITNPTAEPAPPVKEERERVPTLTPNQRDVVKAIEEKAGKPGFKTTLRYMSIDNRDRFTAVNNSLIIGMLSQFTTQNLNGFKIDKATKTKGKWVFKKFKALMRKKRLYFLYITRTFGFQTIVMNTEELASIYHFPTTKVKAPRLQRIEAKKSEPPANLPIE